MGSFSIWHWLVVLAVILVLFGGGNKISGLMGDFAKGIKSFKKNMNEPDDESMEDSTKPTSTIAGPANRSATNTTTREPSTTA
jgi:sec-independent protein translocase protein TatA